MYNLRYTQIDVCIHNLLHKIHVYTNIKKVEKRSISEYLPPSTMDDNKTEKPTIQFKCNEYMRLYKSKQKLASETKECNQAISALEQNVEDELRNSLDDSDPIQGDPSMHVPIQPETSADFEAIVFSLRPRNSFKALTRASLMNICNRYYQEQFPDDSKENQERMTELLVTFIWDHRTQHTNLTLKRKMVKRSKKRQSSDVGDMVSQNKRIKI